MAILAQRRGKLRIEGFIEEEDLLRAPIPLSKNLTPDQRAEWNRCAADIVHFVNAHVKTFDPRLLPGDSTVPFHLFPRQKEFLHWIGEREAAKGDGLAEKSRDVGFTFLCGAYALHGWLFRKGFSCGFGSRKLEYVDDIGNPKSIFEKIRIMRRSLSGWMLPAGWNEKKHDNFARMVNPEIGSTITGEGGDNIGRGDRTTIYFVDEAAFLEHADLVERSLSATSNVRIWVSTPNGPGNLFCRKRQSGKVPVFTFNWRDDPRKDQAWYNMQVNDLDPVTVAQEIDIDYTASIEGIVCPAKWVRAAVEFGKGCHLPLLGSLVAGFDVAGGGENADRNVIVPRRSFVVFEPIDWGGMSTTESAWFARDEADRLGISAYHYDVCGIGEGVKGTWDGSEKPLSFQSHAVNGGASPSFRVWPDGKMSVEKFFNLRAELWFLLRERLRKTHEFMTQGIEHPADEMIALPDHPTLISDLSLPLSETTETGKIRMESKIKMRARGVKSPDFADALVYSLYDPPAEPPRFMVF